MRPYCAAAAAPNGVVKENCITGLLVVVTSELSVSQDWVGALTPLKSQRRVLISTWPSVPVLAAPAVFPFAYPPLYSQWARVDPSVKLVLTVATPGSGLSVDTGLASQFATSENVAL